MTTHFSLILLGIMFLTACSSTHVDSALESGFEVEQEYVDGSPEIICITFPDTSICGITYNYKLRHWIDTIGNLEREGNYINDQAIGIHKFYKNNQLEYIREYILFSKEQLDLLNTVVDSINLADLDISGEKTYLNASYYISKNDTIESRSHFVTIKQLNHLSEGHDTISFFIKLHEPEYKVSHFQVYYTDLIDTTLLRDIAQNGNHYTFKQSVNKKGNQFIDGLVLMWLTNDSLATDTMLAWRVTRIHKEIMVD